MLIPIHETFQSTVQGEGYFCGVLVDFIRLYGCPVGCNFCDTGYAQGGKDIARENISIEGLISELKSPRVVISGGEPFIHKNLPNLCQAIINSGRDVSIETSGFGLDIAKEIPEFVWITLSPKEHLNPKYSVNLNTWNRANEVKIVISDGNELEYYREHLSKKSWQNIY